MTRQRIDAHSTEFGLWLRQQRAIDSSLGFVASNIDFLWRNYKTGLWMFIEEKRYGAKVTFAQQQMFRIIHQACADARGYMGFHVLVFEHTSPDDGRMWLNDLEITKAGLIEFLTFSKKIMMWRGVV